MENNQIHFELKNGKVKVHHRKPLPITDFFQIIFTGLLAAMQGVASKAPEGKELIIREDLYDKFNFVASNVLEMFAPEIEMRPHLTTQAILEAENKIIREGRAEWFKNKNSKEVVAHGSSHKSV